MSILETQPRRDPEWTRYPWTGVAILSFTGVAILAWQGRLGFPAMLLLAVSAAAYWLARRATPPAGRPGLDLIAKALFTVGGIMALLRHPIPAAGGVELPIYAAIARYANQVDLKPFLFFAAVAMAVKFLGVISSAFGWHLLLVGQRVRFPFWSQVMTAFLIGRFIGTFLPSTIGLDGYTLYEASRYSNEWTRCVTAKLIEKVVGVTGLFLAMVLTLPFGYQVIRDVTAQAGRPDAAPMLATAIAAVGGGIVFFVVIVLVWPVILIRALELFGQLMPASIHARITRFADAVGAYHGQVGLLLATLLAKFITHFTTAAVYFFTALAIGVAGASFWPITFGSTIQILATVLSPTIAGEGAREAFQALLLSKHLGGVAQAVLSAALGFIAAEAATMWGGAFLWVRKPGWRPTFTIVDEKQVDYSWIHDEEEASVRLFRHKQR